MALHYPELYGLKPFEQVLTKNLMANLVNFNNAGGTLGRFFNYRAIDLQAASWMPWRLLCFLITLPISFLNCFLAGAMHTLALCNTFLSGIFSNVFGIGSGVPILDVLGVRKSLRKYGLIFANQLLDCHGKCFTWNTFRRWKKLNSRGPIPIWFVSVSNFIKCSGMSNDVVVAFYPALANVVCDTGFVSEQLLATKCGSIDVYIDGSVKSLGFIDACGSTAAYFLKANTSISVKVLGLLFFMLVELQAITLVLECVPYSSIVTLFMDSQASLNICKFDVDGFGPNFQCKCWIEKEHICQAILNKNLSVT
ncbi:hypothetical protein G9A89_023288 [Geosiphon pyriformis]|nr:hypothetical protein G9A89_023288 [Geosiphon pyriformis]